MTDDMSETGGQDRKMISLTEDCEVREWTEDVERQLGVRK